ncbi:toxin VasX [Thalassospira xiamenensis]|uniref:Toxin VasX N-terminal region domain-containing protein n=1 Tax=Thalassospira xiamenensis TaxID=220697 RepID=A0A367XJ52_9PROT|nr:toxin VasX [Thalassospira xiamenensis]KZB51073.1 hypothetical protein AUP41_08180 [Thalassospira xiamenensis]MCK2167783.1 hypothetical protein [Thalassospira xiamenensis]RCK53160.1 hypothetical protein TH44_02865 [Thalassospira xiamenensis]
MDYGDFSANADAEETFFPCQRQTIPILPVRFSLLPFDLDSLQKPTSISNPGSYVIRTLRRGFVYAYVEHPQEPDGATDRQGPGSWYVFRFDTKGQDINSDFVPDKTENYHRADYSFTKYEWTDHYGEDEWKYDTATPPKKTIWVPSWASKVWLAYSEYRWPPSFFRKGHDAGYRKQLMQPVNLRGTNKWAAHIDKAPELVEEYMPSSMRTDGGVNQWLLDLSQVRFASAKPPQVTEDCGILVALHDRLGDVRELHCRLAEMIKHRQSFADAHIYPLQIGQICEGLKDHIPTRDSWYSVRTPALAEGWEDAYGKLKQELADLEEDQNDVLREIINHLKDEDDFGVGKQVNLGFAERDDLDAIIFAGTLLGAGIRGIGATARGHLALRAALGGEKEELGGDQLQKYLKNAVSVFKGYNGGLANGFRRWRFTFDIILEAVAIELAMEKMNNLSLHQEWQEAIEKVYRPAPDERLMLKKVSLRYNDAVKFLQGNFSESQLEDLLLGIDDTGKLHLSGVRRPDVNGATPMVEMPAAEIRGKVTLLGGLTTERNILTLDASLAGVSLFLGMWGLVETAKTHQKVNELHKKGAVTTALTSKEFKLTAAAIGIMEGVYSIHGKLATLSGPVETLSIKNIKMLYQKALPRLSNDLLYAPEVSAAKGVGRFAGTALSRVSCVMGALVSAGEAYRGYERGDLAQLIGNAAMAIASMMMLFPGVGTIAGATVLLIGFVITLYQRSDIEERVRTCFWGSSEKYWNDDKRLEFEKLIEISKQLPGDLKDLFLEELHSFQDILWAISITNETVDDNRLIVESAAFAEENAGTVEIRVSLKSGQWIIVHYDLVARQIVSGRNTDDLSIIPSPDRTALSLQLLDQQNPVNPVYGLNIVNVAYTRPATREILKADFSGRERF